MKTNLFRFAMVALCAIVMTGLMACGNNNNDNNDPDKPDTTPAGAKMTFKATFAEKTLEIFDVTFEFLDANGEKKSELVKETLTEKHLYSETLPAQFGFIMHVAEKAGLDRSKYEHMEMTYEIEMLSCVANASGQQLGAAQAYRPYSSVTLNMSKIDTYLESFQKQKIGIIHTYDKDGKFTSSDWK